MNQHVEDKNKQKLILDHLLKYDHFEYFGKKRPLCQYKTNDKCIHFQRISNNNDNFSFIDKKHLYYYYHKPSNRHFATNKQNANDEPFFEYVTKVQRSIRNNYKLSVKAISQHDRLLLLLIGEVITNGYEKDLLPLEDTQFDATKFINDIVKQITNGNHNCDLNSIIDQLKPNYRIFKTVNEKMKHEKHAKTNYILSEVEMLSLILYCNGECNHHLAKCQRDDTYIQKWPIFDTVLNWAIVSLSNFESHEENIYTGLSGVLLDIYQIYKQGRYSYFLYFKSNISFTRDLNVAYEFRGYEGLILGLNIKQCCEEDIWGFLTKDTAIPHACDVSWISKFPTEQEVLVSRDSPFTPYPSKSRQIGKKQWIVCNVGYDDETFERMFLANNQQLR